MTKLLDSCTFRIDKSIPIEGVRDCIKMARVALESLHGAPRARIETKSYLYEDTHDFSIDLTLPIGYEFARLFMGFIHSSYGRNMITVSRTNEVYS